MTRIAIYVPRSHARTEGYKRDSYHVRQNAGLAVVADILKRAGHVIAYTDAAGVANFDFILATITAECDWWPFLRERLTWPKGDYQTVLGGFGVQNVRPYLPFADFFCFGRAEGVIDRLIAGEDPGPSVVSAKRFRADGTYEIRQAPGPYPHPIRLENGNLFTEAMIGCPNKCRFCNYTWHRKYTGGDYRTVDLWAGGQNFTMYDLATKPDQINWDKARTTAIDGMSQRLRRIVHKPVTREILRTAMVNLATMGRRPGVNRRMIFYNILGLPTETTADWHEFMEDLKEADSRAPYAEKKTGILIQSTPFQAKAATPMACAPMSKAEYRYALTKELGKGLRGYRIFEGKTFFVTDSYGVEGLPTVMETAINLRATEEHTDTIVKVARSKEYARASTTRKAATLERHFPLDRFFGEYEPDELPTRYLKSYREFEMVRFGK